MHKTMAAYFGDWLPASHDGVHQPAVVARRPHRARHDRGAAEVGGEVTADARRLLALPPPGGGRSAREASRVGVNCASCHPTPARCLRFASRSPTLPLQGRVARADRPSAHLRRLVEADIPRFSTPRWRGGARWSTAGDGGGGRRASGVLRLQPRRLVRAVADAMAGDHRGGLRVFAWQARRDLRAIGQPCAAGAAVRRQGRDRRVGRRDLPSAR